MAVALPTFAASMRTPPDAFTEPPSKTSPARFSTGALSPVSIDSSTAVAPSMTTPSTGTRSPGRMSRTSPGTTALASTSSSAPFRITRAVRGCISMSARIASVALPFARASSIRPNSTSAMMTAAASK